MTLVLFFVRNYIFINFLNKEMNFQSYYILYRIDL